MKNCRPSKNCLWFTLILLIVVSISACATMPKPNQIIPPKPILNNSGKYMSPYTQDGVVAPWCDKAVKVSMGATIGRTAGAYAGQQALKQVPFIGGLLGEKAGDEIGRGIAIKASGGWEYIRNTSDMSFNSIDDLIVWMYATQSNNEHYKAVLKATSEIYPEIKKRQGKAIQKASMR